MGSRSGVIPGGVSIGRLLESHKQESNLKVEIGGKLLIQAQVRESRGKKVAPLNCFDFFLIGG